MRYLGMVFSLENIAGESAVECRPDLRDGLNCHRMEPYHAHSKLRHSGERCAASDHTAVSGRARQSGCRAAQRRAQSQCGSANGPARKHLDE
jgi:hypothetical protein